MCSGTKTDLRILRSEIAARLDSHGTAGTSGTLEQRSRSYLHELRWPAGVRCPRCDESHRLLWLESRSKWHCYACRYQFSVTAGTLFHNSHLPVWKWFAAVHLMVESPDGISANELRTVLGGSYKTSWFAAHRIRAAMRGRGTEIVRRIIEAREHQPTPELLHDEPHELAASSDTPGRAQADQEDNRLTRMRRALAGTHHHLSIKYLPAYVDERRWRLANVDNPHVFRDTVLALLHGESISYGQLTASV